MTTHRVPRPTGCPHPAVDVIEVTDEIVHDPPPRRVVKVGYCRRCHLHVASESPVTNFSPWATMPTAELPAHLRRARRRAGGRPDAA